MKISETKLKGVLLIEPKIFGDDRGFFLETYQAERYKEMGISDHFVQDNHSRSMCGALRGMHFQVKHPQAQIVTVMRGRIYDVCIDLRKGSPTFGGWVGVELGDSSQRQIYMAPGFAHGFCVLTDWADLHYKVSCNYDSEDEGGLFWNDSDIGVEWPIHAPIVSARDRSFPRLSDIEPRNMPHISYASAPL